MESIMEQRKRQAGEMGTQEDGTRELDQLFLTRPPREAYPLLLAKSGEGSGRALLLLALYLDGGYGTFFLDQGRARVYASAASQAGDPVAPAFCALKDLPNVGESVRVFVRQRERIRALAAEGDFLAQYYLGIMYAYGEGEDPSYEDALAWFEQSAAQGFAAAQLAMGSFLRLVDGGKNDTWREKRLEWYQKAAAKGYAEAQLRLAQEYRLRFHALDQAKIWYERAARQGHPAACEIMGNFWENGYVGQADPAQALAWYRRAYHRGSRTVCFAIASLYEEGRGVPQSWQQAALWYKKFWER
ncbi:MULTISPECIES: tetratricopeptide repeat protein [Acidaminococcus]|uniref:tetratricopeptide repeat protein n=1 Tax=Acidaminococcus TaxID=904 RepID=UPI0032E5239F